MGLVSQAITGLFNGVSQQAEILRQANQAAEQINFTSTVIGGIIRRPPTKHLFSLPSSPANEYTRTQSFSDTEGNDYLVCFHKDSNMPLEIYHLDGTKCTLTYEDTAKDYLDVLEPRRHLKATVIGDYDLVVNTTKVVQMDDTSNETQEIYALFYCKQAIRYVTYTLGGISYTTPKVAETSLQCSSSIVCQELISALGDIPDVTFEHLDNGDSSVIRITGSQAYIDSLTSSDSYGNTVSFLLKGKAKKVEDLPPCAEDGDIMEITGKKEDGFANYWLKWVTADNQWIECTSPDLCNKFDAATMPHQLLRTALYAFEFSAGTTDETLEDVHTVWSSRKVGDSDSAPEPSFVGNSINDIYFFKNRLGLLSGQNTILSRPNEFFNFFPETATDVLDTDPLDMTAGSSDNVNLIHAVPYEENLLLFAEEGGQFIISSGGEIFTANTAAPNLTTSAPCDALCRPIMLGGDVFFVSTAGEYSKVREYFVTTDSQVNEAADITAHCPKYLDAEIHSMAISSNSDMLYCASQKAPNKLFVYRYYKMGSERPQSAWFTFKFPFEILDINNYKDDKVFLLIKKDNQISYEMFDVNAYSKWYLDRQITDTQQTLLGSGETELLIPYDDTSEPFVVVTEDSQGYISVYSELIGSTVTAGENCKVTIPEDITGASKVTIGKTFESSYLFSEWYLKNQNGTGILQGHLRLRTLILDFQDTGDYVLRVKPLHRSERSYIYTGKSLGNLIIGSRHTSSGHKRFALRADSKNTEIKIVSDSILPCNISSASFEGYFTNRNQLT